jgi:CheY-like chemotaxis protein
MTVQLDLSDDSLNGYTILVIDDNQDIINLVTAILNKHKANVLSASNAEKGLKLLFEADVVLVDLCMPGMDGYEFTKQARTNGYKGNIIALTGRAMPHELAAAIAAGCNKTITKPFGFSDFLKSVHEACLVKNKTDTNIK